MTIMESMAAADAQTIGTYYTQDVNESVVLTISEAGSAGYKVNCSETAAITETNGGRFLWEIIDDTQGVTWQNISNPQTPNWTAVDDTETANWTTIPTS
jgi:hypothetical protein